MNFEPRFCLNINKTTAPGKGKSGVMYLTLQRPFVHLEDELRQAFAADQTSRIIVDRRIEERRKVDRPVAVDRRIMHRRRPKEKIIEVLITI